MSPDLHIDQSLARIRGFLGASELTNSAIAAAAGCDEKTVRTLRRGGGNPTAETLRALERLALAGAEAAA